MTDQEAGYVERVAAWLRQPIDWPEVFAPEYRTGFMSACENIADALLSGSWEEQELTAEPGQAGHVEYGVRCPDGREWRVSRDRSVADRERKKCDRKHPYYNPPCEELHLVVQRTVGPWEVAR